MTAPESAPPSSSQPQSSESSQSSQPGTVADAGEHRVIELVRSLVPASPSWVQVGIGDDAAVIEPERNRLEVLTTDVVIEGVHFDRAFCDPASIGHKALAVNLSDLAAMGAAPRTALLSLGLPGSLPFADLEAMLRALVDLATRHKVTLIGGNVARSPGPLFLDVTVTGTVKRRRVLTRHGGRVGDALYVTGSLGAAAAGLVWLRRRMGEGAAGSATTAGASGASEASEASEAVKEAVDRFLKPQPRMRFGLIAGRTRAATACMDLSDGLADAVRQLARASGTGAVIEAETLPIHPGATEILSGESKLSGREAAPLKAVLSGGEDYELLLAVSRRSLRRFLAVQRLAGVPATRIGTLTAGSDLVLRREGIDEPLPAGFEHFA
jgi:thiamine-monophosphate kinase